jgi:translation initiation factor IF-3
MATRDAREYATSKGLDLVEVAPDARPPVCRVMDYGKFMYEQAKKERAARKTQKQIEIKGIRIRPDTDSYHIGFKVRQARSFLLKGNKVRITCLFKGRERSHPEIARNVMKQIAEQLGDVAVIEQHPNFEGRNMTMILAVDPAALERHERALKAARRKAREEQQGQVAGQAPPPNGQETGGEPEDEALEDFDDILDEDEDEFDDDDLLDDDDEESDDEESND